MAERTVKAAVTSYQAPDGTTRFALRGETVDVADDYLETFDRLENVAVRRDEPVESPAAAVEDPASEFTPQEPPRAGRGSGVDAWATYARSIGITVPDDATRDDIIALVDDSNE